MNVAMSVIPHLLTPLIRRIRYRYGFPFITSGVLAVVTISRCQPSRATSIWTFALLTLLSTAFTLLCGGRFRTFFIAIAVTPPFLFLLRFFLPSPYFPSKALGEYFLYFVAAPILLVWAVSTVLSRTERHA